METDHKRKKRKKHTRAATRRRPNYNSTPNRPKFVFNDRDLLEERDDGSHKDCEILPACSTVLGLFSLNRFVLIVTSCIS